VSVVPLAVPPSHFPGLQRVALVALLAPVLLLMAAATVPATVVLAFVRDGPQRIGALLAAFTSFGRMLLAESRTPGGGPRHRRRSGG